MLWHRQHDFRTPADFRGVIQIAAGFKVITEAATRVLPILLEINGELLERELWTPFHSFFESSKVFLVRFAPAYMMGLTSDRDALDVMDPDVLF